jgi:hypothetical protein
MKHLTQIEKEQLVHDWKYKGYAIVDILTESEVDNVIDELNTLRINRNQSDTKWSEYEPYMHPHKESVLVEKILAHPKAIECMELLLDSEIQGVQTWAYFKPPGELGRDAHQDGFYSQAGWNKIANISISLDDSDESNGIAAVLEKYFNGTIPTTRSEGDPNQGWGKRNGGRVKIKEPVHIIQLTY